MRCSRLSILAALSAVLTVILLCLWARSCWVGDSILYAATDRYCFLKSVDGAIYVGIIKQRLIPVDTRFSVFDIDPGLHAFIGWSFRRLSPRAYFGVGPETNLLWTYSLSYWLLVIVFSVIPSMWLYNWWVRRRRRTIGACLQCGYDLRASKDRCPECGAAIAVTR